MANGFCPHDAAGREIGAERRQMRHSSNSFDASDEFLPILRIFFATPRNEKNRTPNVWVVGRKSHRGIVTQCVQRYDTRTTALRYSTSGEIVDSPGNAAPTGQRAHETE